MSLYGISSCKELNQLKESVESTGKNIREPKKVPSSFQILKRGLHLCFQCVQDVLHTCIVHREQAGIPLGIEIKSFVA